MTDLYIVRCDNGGSSSGPMGLEEARLEIRILTDRHHAKQDLWGIKRTDPFYLDIYRPYSGEKL
jgi:hypothetical protein